MQSHARPGKLNKRLNLRVGDREDQIFKYFRETIGYNKSEVLRLALRYYHQEKSKILDDLYYD